MQNGTCASYIMLAAFAFELVGEFASLCNEDGQVQREPGGWPRDPSLAEWQRPEAWSEAVPETKGDQRHALPIRRNVPASRTRVVKDLSDGTAPWQDVRYGERIRLYSCDPSRKAFA